jgi:nucleotide-binding universal stress UspA family protein
MAHGSESMSLLVVVEESPAAKRAVSYVAKLIGRRRGFHIVLMHLFPPLPPDLLEVGAAAELRTLEKLEWAQRILRKGGVSAREIDFAFSNPKDSGDAANAVLKVARAQRCHTIVVAHHAHSWFREMFGGHLAEELLRQAKRFALWVVE